MANFNMGIDCPSEEAAEKLKDAIESIDIYQDGLDAQEERVSVISKQGLLEELKKYASANSVELSVEVWPEDMEYDEAEESDDMETHEYK